MSLKTLLQEIQNGGQDQDYVNGIYKTAEMMLDVINDMQETEEAWSKQAEEQMVKLSEEEKEAVRTFIDRGRYLARGEYNGKIAGYQEGNQDGMEITLKVAEAMYGPEVAQNIHYAILKEAGVTDEEMAQEGELAQVQQDITEAAAQKLLEAAGGPEKLTDEQRAELLRVAQQAGELGVQQIMQGQGGAPEAGAPAAK